MPIRLSTKTLTNWGEIMKSDNWRTEAENMYFNHRRTLAYISKQVGVSAVSLSKHFNSLPQYTAEKKLRVEQNRSNRTDYFREHKRTSRLKNAIDNINYASNGATLRAEHENAVRVLSREMYFHE